MPTQHKSLVCSQLLDNAEYHIQLCINFYWRRRRHTVHRMCLVTLFEMLRDLRTLKLSGDLPELPRDQDPDPEVLDGPEGPGCAKGLR